MVEISETVDCLRIANLQIVQAANGYRFSLDPILLSYFAASSSADQVVDLGTGSGVIPLVLAHLTQASRLVGIELQPAQAARAAKSVVLNGLQGRIEIMHADLRQVRQLLPVGRADLVVANPPYRMPGSGRLAPDDERAAARHELAGNLSDFVAAAAWLLADRGRFAIVYLVERLPELLMRMVEQKIEPKRLRMIHPRCQEPARMVLVEGRKNVRPGMVVERPLYIYKSSGQGREYTDEILEMYDEGGVPD
jgi:tRNA1Val (adenine37-N6)-methyltransferase